VLRQNHLTRVKALSKTNLLNHVCQGTLTAKPEAEITCKLDEICIMKYYGQYKGAYFGRACQSFVYCNRPGCWPSTGLLMPTLLDKVSNTFPLFQKRRKVWATTVKDSQYNASVEPLVVKWNSASEDLHTAIGQHINIERP
jgi:hypothetical protein